MRVEPDLRLQVGEEPGRSRRPALPDIARRPAAQHVEGHKRLDGPSRPVHHRQARFSVPRHPTIARPTTTWGGFDRRIEVRPRPPRSGSPPERSDRAEAAADRTTMDSPAGLPAAPPAGPGSPARPPDCAARRDRRRDRTTAVHLGVDDAFVAQHQVRYGEGLRTTAARSAVDAGRRLRPAGSRSVKASVVEPCGIVSGTHRARRFACRAAR